MTVSARGFASRPDLPLAATDNFSVEIAFADGGVGTLHYAADAPIGPGKERFETSSPGVYAEIEDYRRGRIWRGRRKKRASAAGARTRASRRSSSSSPSSRGGGWRPPPPESFWLSTPGDARGRALARERAAGDRRPRAPSPEPREPAPEQAVEAVAEHGR